MTSKVVAPPPNQDMESSCVYQLGDSVTRWGTVRPGGKKIPSGFSDYRTHSLTLNGFLELKKPSTLDEFSRAEYPIY